MRSVPDQQGRGIRRWDLRGGDPLTESFHRRHPSPGCFCNLVDPPPLRLPGRGPCCRARYITPGVLRVGRPKVTDDHLVLAHGTINNFAVRTDLITSVDLSCHENAPFTPSQKDGITEKFSYDILRWLGSRIENLIQGRHVRAGMQVSAWNDLPGVRPTWHSLPAFDGLDRGEIGLRIALQPILPYSAHIDSSVDVDRIHDGQEFCIPIPQGSKRTDPEWPRFTK